MLVGNLTRDPEMRMLASGQQMVRFGVAVNRVYKDAQGQRHEEANFFNVTAFAKQAETLAHYAKKGTLIFIDGRLQARTVMNDKGESRTYHDIVVEGFQFLGGAGKGKTLEDEEEQAA